MAPGKHHIQILLLVGIENFPLSRLDISVDIQLYFDLILIFSECFMFVT